MVARLVLVATVTWAGCAFDSSGISQPDPETEAGVDAALGQPGIDARAAADASDPVTTFQQDVAGYTGAVDTELREEEPATERGGAPEIGWEDDPPQVRALLIRFGGIFGVNTNQIPVGAQIIAASLSYAVRDTGDDGAVHEMVTDWDGASTWASFTEFPSGDLGPALMTAPGDGGRQQVDVTASLERWSNAPGENLGWAILGVDTSGVGVASSEFENTIDRPRLVVQWRP